MPSAFRRGPRKRATEGSAPTANASPAASNFRPPRGVKPWQGGTYLTSTGLNDLDSILGGGQLLASSILLEEDRLWTRDLAQTLVKYWCAEAISQGQELVIPTFSKASTNPADDEDSLFGDDSEDEDDQPWRNLKLELHDLLLGLPRNLHWDKQKKKEEKAKKELEQAEANASDITSGINSMGLGPMAILEEDEEEEEGENDNADDGLEVAWQYKKSVQQERLAQSKSQAVASTTTDVFCHSYDLSARLKDQTTLDPSSYICELASTSKSKSSQSNGYSLFSDLVKLLKNKSSDNKAIRLLLYHPPLDALSVALPLLMAHIRQNELPVVLMIAHAPTPDVKSTIMLGRAADVVLATEGFASRKEYPPPAEFRHLLGILNIAKTTRKRTEVAASIYGFKRDRRKLHIPLLHIPPEDYAEGGGSVGGGGVRSGAGRPAEAKKPSNSGGMGCSSNMSGSLLDF